MTRTEWNDEGGTWRVQVEDLKSGHVSEEACDILISATGVLNAWRWPEIPGLNDFKGTLLHSAKWDEEVEVQGKTVGIIGNG